MRTSRRRAALVGRMIFSASALGIASTPLFAGTANAADLTCVAPPGADVVAVEGAAACGARIDALSTAFARALDGVAFARADSGGSAVGVAHSGGVAASETTAGRVGAVSIGQDSVAIVSPDPGAVALALSLTRGQTFVGTVAEGVRCDAGAGIAVNLTTGQVCISDGASVWSSVVALP